MYTLGYQQAQNHQLQAEERHCIQADWLPDEWPQNLQEFLNKSPSKDLVTPTMAPVPILEYSLRLRQPPLQDEPQAQAQAQAWITQTQEIIMTQIQEIIMICPWPQEVKKSVTFWMTY